MQHSAANPTSAPPCKQSPYSQKTDTPPTQSKVFNRTVGRSHEDITPEVERQIHRLFNNQLPAANVPQSQARALRDYIIVQLNNYLALTLQQPDLAIANPADSVSGKDSNISPPPIETGNQSNSPLDSATLAEDENRQQGLCRQLMNLKTTVTSGNLGLDNDKIRQYLKLRLSKNAYQDFKSILSKQPKTEKIDSVDTTSRMINTVLIMGPEIYQHFFDALTHCGYHGLLQPEIHPRQKSQKPAPLLGRSKSFSDRSRQRHLPQPISQWPLSSGYTRAGYYRDTQQSRSQAAIESRHVGVVRPSDNSSVVPIRINKKVSTKEAKAPLLQSFAPIPPPHETPCTGQLAANAIATEVQRRGFALSKTSTSKGGSDSHLPPPPADWVIEEEPEEIRQQEQGGSCEKLLGKE